MDYSHYFDMVPSMISYHIVSSQLFSRTPPLKQTKLKWWKHSRFCPQGPPEVTRNIHNSVSAIQTQCGYYTTFPRSTMSFLT